MAGPLVTAVPGVLEVRSPSDRRLLATLTVQGDEAVAEAVRAARDPQTVWADRTPRDRAAAMWALARELERRADDVVTTLVAETGKPRAEAHAEVVVSVELLRYYRRVAPRRLARRRVSTGWMLWKRAFVERDPLGVVGAITPWNYPFILPMDVVTPALFAGNAVVLKPSEHTPLTALMIPELCEAAGLPAGLVQVVTGAGATGEALVRADVDHIHFTGSTDVGRRVMAAAAERLTPVTLELGGKDPAIVLEDADLRRAAKGIVFGAFFNAGQTCISIERVYVVEAVRAELTRLVVEEARQLRTGLQGDDAAASFDVGPMITAEQRDLVADQIEEALRKGARALVGGAPDRRSRIVAPTVLVDVDDSMAVVREETFGPVLPIIGVADGAEAIRRANTSGYGLFASVWTADRARGTRVLRALRVGGGSVNDSLSHYAVAALPMGGVGSSGFGRRRGVEGLEAMTRTRSVLVDRLGLGREPWWFPYDERGSRLARALLDWRGRGGLGGAARAVRRLAGR